MNLVERIKRILLQPKQEWEIIAGETTSISDLYRSYIIPLAAIGPAASIIGLSIVGIGMFSGSSFRIPFLSAALSAAVNYLLSLAGIYVTALVIDFLAPTFSGEKNLDQALKLAAYSATAAWIAAAFIIIPSLGILGILGLYSLYLLYLGIPVLMKAPQEKSMVYTVAVAVTAIIIFAVIGAIARTFIPHPMGM